jgi:hypothetical protein
MRKLEEDEKKCRRSVELVQDGVKYGDVLLRTVGLYYQLIS